MSNAIQRRLAAGEVVETSRIGAFLGDAVWQADPNRAAGRRCSYRRSHRGANAFSTTHATLEPVSSISKPVSECQKRKSEKQGQRRAPKRRRFGSHRRMFARQRLGPRVLTRGTIGASPALGIPATETALLSAALDLSTHRRWARQITAEISALQPQWESTPGDSAVWLTMQSRSDLSLGEFPR